MKKKKILIGSLIAVVFLVISVCLIPVFQMHIVISNVSNLENFKFDASLIFREEQLSEEQNISLYHLCNLLGVEEKLCWTIKGDVYNGAAHMKLYNADSEDALTEMYMNEKQQIINIKMIYESIISRNAFIESILPAWSGAEYISFEQIAYIMGLDINQLLGVKQYEEKKSIGIWQSFLIFCGMEKQYNNEKLQLNTEADGYKIVIENLEKGQFNAFSVEVKENTETKIIEQYKINFELNTVSEVVVPESMLDAGTVENLRMIWSILTAFSDKK